MGWSGGSQLAEDLWRLVRPNILEKDRKKIARKIIDLFESEDCDTIDEAERLCADAGRVFDEEEDEIVYR